MASIDLRVTPHGDGWTVRHGHALFERHADARVALACAQRQAALLRQAGRAARVRLTDRLGRALVRCPRGRLPGELPPYDC